MNLYNDIDKPACAWMRELAAQGHIPPGDVDSRSIADLTGADVARYTQSHFFAGIAGWPLALRLAGWPPDRPVWTGSCPCQPFSSAGKRKGQADERHVWPEFARLIGECRPPVVFGEQVASAVGHGWLDGVFADLEGLGYACGAAVLGAHSVGAPHIRQRLWWVAYAQGERAGSIAGSARKGLRQSHGGGPACGLGIAKCFRRKRGAATGFDGAVAENGAHADTVEATGTPGGLGIAGRNGSQGQCSAGSAGRAVERARAAGGLPHPAHADGWCGEQGEQGRQGVGRGGPANCGPWDNYIIVPCADGKSRRLEPSISPLVDGVPARVVRLRGYGNAIVPQLAAVWIKECMSVIDGLKADVQVLIGGVA